MLFSWFKDPVRPNHGWVLVIQLKGNRQPIRLGGVTQAEYANVLREFEAHVKGDENAPRVIRVTTAHGYRSVHAIDDVSGLTLEPTPGYRDVA